jgi:hypothetical protein
MHFQIERKHGGHLNGPAGFIWRLVAKERVVCCSARTSKTIAEARGDIADAKRSMGAARYAKVEEPA